MKCVFITGGTGLLGVNIVRELLQKTPAKVVLLLRNPSEKKRTGFFRDLLAFNGSRSLDLFSYQRIEFVEGDVTLPNLGLASSVRDRLVREVDMIFHSAAVITLSGAERETQAVNVGGTRAILDFGMECRERGRLEKIIHVSTVAVSGNREGVVYEDDLDAGQGFNNPYEKSKFQAEQLVNEYRRKGLSITIVRPSMVIGGSRMGFTNNFNMFYFQLRLLSQGVLDMVPLREDAAFNLIPADYAAKAICLIAAHPSCGNYHIVNSHEIKVRTFFEKVSTYLGYKRPKFLSDLELKPSALGGVRGKVLGIYYPYIAAGKKFNAVNAGDVLRRHKFEWPLMNGPLLTKMLDFCVFSGYVRLGSEVKHEVGAYNA
jgi:thioester reductase-like protein